MFPLSRLPYVLVPRINTMQNQATTNTTIVATTKHNNTNEYQQTQHIQFENNVSQLEGIREMCRQIVQQM